MNLLKNSTGQVAVEYILLTVVIGAMTLAAQKYFSSTNMIGDYVQKPWELVAGMIETGVWGDARQTRAKHPGKLERHLSLQGEAD